MHDVSRDHTSKKYIDKNRLSKAFLDYVGRHLATRCMRPTKSAVADEIGVSPAMVSQIGNGGRALKYETIAKYAQRAKIAVGELFLELFQIAAEAEDVPPLDSPGSENHGLLEGALDELGRLEALVRKSGCADSREFENFYVKTLVRSYKLFRDVGMPLVSVAIGFRPNDRWQFLVTSPRASDKELKATKVSLPVPSGFSSQLDAWLQEEDVAVKSDKVVDCPGIESRGEEEEILFWRALANCDESLFGQKFRVWAEPIFNARTAIGDKSNSHSIIMLFLFDYRFTLAGESRFAMHLLASMVHQIRSKELHAWAQKVSQFCPLLPPLPGALGQVWEQPPGTDKPACVALSEALRDFSRLLWNQGHQVLKIEAWCLDRNQQHFFRILEESCQNSISGANAVGEAARQGGSCADESAKTFWGPRCKSWREMTRVSLRKHKAILYVPNNGLAKEHTNEKKKVVLGLPFFRTHRKEKDNGFGTGVLYIWYVDDQVAGLVDLVSSRASVFPGLEICYPANPERLLSAWPTQLSEATQHPNYFEIDTVCSMAPADSSSLLQREARDLKRPGRTERC